MLRKRKKVLLNPKGKIVIPSAKAKPSGEIKLDGQRIDWKEYKWKSLFLLLKQAI